MNASQIINDDMTLEEKLKAIDTAMKDVQVQHSILNPGAAPLDPADLTMCESCQ